MSLSKRHLSEHTQPVCFDIDAIAKAIKAECPHALFALLHGSSKDGCARPGSDIDIAVFAEGEPSFDLVGKIADIVSRFAPGVHCDIGFLNSMEPIYGFEALKGRLLFARDDETYLRFFSLICRLYESQMFDYERQLRYRKAAA